MPTTTMLSNVAVRTLCATLAILLIPAALYTQTDPKHQGRRTIQLASTTPKKERFTWSHTQMNTSLQTEDLYIVEDPAAVYCVDRRLDKRELGLRLALGAVDYEFGSLEVYSAHLIVDVEGLDAQGNSFNPALTWQATLRVEHTGDGKPTPEQVYYVDITSAAPLNPVCTLQVRVNAYAPSFPAGTAAYYQNAIEFEAFYEETYAWGAEDINNPTPGPLVEPIDPGGIYVFDGPRVTFEWEYDGACEERIPSYEFQLLRLLNNAPVPNPNGIPQEISAIVDWDRALTIETGSSAKKITLTVAEGTGYYCWRVRPIGDYYPGGIADDRNWGAWSTAPSQGAQVDLETPGGMLNGGQDPWPDCMLFYHQFDEDKNWNYSRRFTEGAEGVRIGENIVYADKLLRQRQSQAYLNNFTSVLVNQTVPDYSGRPVLTSLPAPVVQAGLGYQQQFMQSGPGQLYTAANFDADANWKNPDPLAAGVLDIYYSDGNPEIQIPDAEHYPFSRTTMYPDGAGRPLEQGGPGSTYRIGGGHTTRIFYATPTDAELIALMGDEAPAAATVQKIITMDPNTTATVQYISKNGLTLATGYDIQDDPHNPLLALNEAQNFAPTTIVDAIDLDIPAGDYALSASKRVTFVDPTDLTLHYTLSPQFIQSACSTYCKTCDYSIRFTVYDVLDPENPVVDETVDIGPLDCGAPGNYTYTYTRPNLPAGTYVIERRLETSNQDPSSLAANPLGHSYLETHRRAVGAEVEQTLENSAILTQIETYLDAGQIEQLYDYLDAQAALPNPQVTVIDQIATIQTECCEIEIPLPDCNQNRCDGARPDFEQFLLDTWTEPNYVYHDNTGEPLGGFPPAIFYFFFRDGGYTYSYGQAPFDNGASGAFNALIDHMIDEDGYDCERLWSIWEPLVMSFGVMGTINGDGNPAESERNFDYDLLHAFLERAGYRIEGVSNCRYGDCNGSGEYGQGYLEFAHRFMRYDESSGYACEDCEIRFQIDVINDATGLPNAVTFSGQDPDGNDICDPANGDECWNRFAACVAACNLNIAQEHMDELVPDGCTDFFMADQACVEAFVEDAEASCEERCEGRFSGFVDGVIAAYHADGHNVEGYEIFFDPDGQPTQPAVAMSDVLCKARALVEHCREQCELDVILDAGGTYVETVGTAAQQAAYEQAVGWGYEIELTDRGSCSSGFTRVKKTIAALDLGNARVWLLNSRLQEKLQNLPSVFEGLDQEDLDEEQSYPFGQDNALTLCRFFENYAGDLLGGSNCWQCQSQHLEKSASGDDRSNGAGSCFPAGSQSLPNIFDLRAGMDAGFYLKNGCELWFWRTCVVGFAQYTQEIKLCDDFCAGGCPSEICFRWVEPQELTPDIVIEPVTCAQIAVNVIRQRLDDEKTRCREEFVEDIAMQYAERCIDPNGVNDMFTIEYAVGLNHFTLYYYDNAGNLVRTVPPKGVSLNATSRHQIPAHTTQTFYEYNSLGHVTRQKTPDGGTTQFWYDDIGRLRFSQDAQQQFDGTYSYTKYDELSRTVEVGQSSEDVGNLAAHTGDNNFPGLGLSEQRVLTVYSATTASVMYRGEFQQHVTNRVSYTHTDDGVHTYYSYDVHGNVQWLVQEIPPYLGQKSIEYEYDLYSGNVTQVYYNRGQGDQFIQRYTYDVDNRITQVESSRYGRIWDREAQYDYYAHGPLRRAELGEDRLQGLDYTYTIQGWLKALNHPALTDQPGADPGQDGQSGPNVPVARDAWGMMLQYHQNDFLRSNSPFNSDAANPYTLTDATDLFNGNISGWSMHIDDDAQQGAGGTELNAYIYRYDVLNRLKTADYHTWGGSWLPSADFGTAYSYDANGNMTQLDRFAAGGVQMDRFTYSYPSGWPGSNRLDHISDPIAPGAFSDDIDNQLPGNYSYDLIGNLTAETAEGITSIEWTVYGKVAGVNKSNGERIDYVYDAAGHRVLKEVRPNPNEVTRTYYVREANGNVLAVYTESETTEGISAPGNGKATPGDALSAAQDIKLAELYVYGSGSQGRVSMLKPDVLLQGMTIPVDTYTRTLGDKYYELTDHLGNVRVVTSDIKQPYGGIGTGMFVADVQAFNNYYPFGMLQDSRSWQSESYRYGFNGMEQDGEVKGTGNSYTTQFRQYDPRVGRWLSLDPLMDQFPHVSPFVGFGDNPIFFIDPQGLMPTNNVAETLNSESDDEQDLTPEEQAALDYTTANIPANNTTVYDSENPTQNEASYAPAVPLTIPPQALPAIGAAIVEGGPYVLGAIGIGVLTLDVALLVGAAAIIPDADFPYSATLSAPVANPALLLPNAQVIGTAIDAPFPIPLDYASSDGATTRPGPDGYITLFRGVASDNVAGFPNPAYPPSITGLAVPYGGPAGPLEANDGYPSNFTFWTVSPIWAYRYATRGLSGIGTIIAIRVPWGEVFPNSSPDKYEEGEVQILGSKRGIPIPVVR